MKEEDGGDFSAATGGIGLARYAMEYIDAAMLVNSQRGHKAGILEGLSPVPAYFLAMHGIELTLKAFIRHASLKRPQRIHRVLDLYHQAMDMGLGSIYRASTLDQSILFVFDEMNEYQALRYHEPRVAHFLRWSCIEPLMLRLHQSVGPHVGFKSFDEPRYPDDWGHFLDRPEGMTIDELAEWFAKQEDERSSSCGQA